MKMANIRTCEVMTETLDRWNKIRYTKAFTSGNVRSIVISVKPLEPESDNDDDCTEVELVANKVKPSNDGVK